MSRPVIRTIAVMIPVFLLTACVTGCVTRRAIYNYSVHIKGSVVDSHTDEPVDGVAVTFYHDFTSPRNGVEIGRSLEGVIAVEHNSSIGMKDSKMIWGEYKGLRGRYEIELDRAGYQAFTRMFEFDSSKNSSSHVIDLGIIRLEPE